MDGRRFSVALRAGCAGVMALACLLGLAGSALAHDVAQGDRGFLALTHGIQPGPFAYLGAKHMVTGTDHLLFLVGVVFFLFRWRQVALYVSLFALGHSATLILGVLLALPVDPRAVDAIIALSIVYKALDNLDAFTRWFGWRPDPRLMVLGFGLCHGLGLATKLQDLGLARDGLVVNLVAFNLGVEAGQLMALGAIVLVMSWWRRSPRFPRQALVANVALMTAGLVLFGQQIAGLIAGGAA